MSRASLVSTSGRLVLVAAGSLVAAVGIQAFLVPANLLTAGVAGLALLLSYVTPLQTGLLLLLLNLPIFALGLRFVDRDFVGWSLLGMVGLSLALALTEPLAHAALVKDWWLNALTGAILCGLGTGLVFRARASQGGTDIVAAVIRRWREVRIGPLLFALNASVVLVLVFVSGLEPALATVFVILVESVVAEKTIVGVDASKALTIITERPDDVARALMARMGRGATFYQGRGAFTGAEKQIVSCIVTVRQLALAKALVREVDPACFTTVHDVVEVIGEGFTRAPI